MPPRTKKYRSKGGVKESRRKSQSHKAKRADDLDDLTNLFGKVNLNKEKKKGKVLTKEEQEKKNRTIKRKIKRT